MSTPHEALIAVAVVILLGLGVLIRGELAPDFSFSADCGTRITLRRELAAADEQVRRLGEAVDPWIRCVALRERAAVLGRAVRTAAACGETAATAHAQALLSVHQTLVRDQCSPFER